MISLATTALEAHGPGLQLAHGLLFEFPDQITNCSTHVYIHGHYIGATDGVTMPIKFTRKEFNVMILQLNCIP